MLNILGFKTRREYIEKLMQVIPVSDLSLDIYFLHNKYRAILLVIICGNSINKAIGAFIKSMTLFIC